MRSETETIFRSAADSARSVLALLSFAVARFRYRRARGLKLNLGCGERRRDGYLNADIVRSGAADIRLDISSPLPFPDNSADAIEAYHLLEHLPRRKTAAVLKDWIRVLAPGGKLVVECPDLDAAMGRCLSGDAAGLDGIYGLQRYPGDTHFFGYNFPRLKRMLEEAGGRSVNLKPASDYHATSEPCIRVECTK
ncbi:MAG: methyltransferase domain-containing protein [Elusimicrobiales bacterium]|nr:methyltransferase domain-containing protein [Elusimicrobiales bacterium]